ncbi:MAG: hypothetical protein JWO64_3335, partial [Hyphomicrobiales bacterium]|nr:hypothetical protein [Hyphomicrobiales bacterium]
ALIVFDWRRGRAGQGKPAAIASTH